MSGGHFNYDQYKIQQIADEIEQAIIANDKLKYGYSAETIEEFKKGLVIMRQAYIYAQRIDWIMSGDDGEESFHKRLKKELDEL
jgi:hypothetical protein